MPLMFGSEIEYAFTAFNRDGVAIPPNISIPRLLEAARSRLRYMPDGGSAGMFLSCGRRLYCDCMHPELTTPECISPGEFLTYLIAGDRVILDLANTVEQDSPDVSRVEVYRFQVDYSGTRHTWGCHESYLHRVAPEALPNLILAHLVSRIIYTGPGGFNNLSPGIEFLIEPRVPHLGQPISPSSTRGRGIYHTKNESLSSPGYNRLHVLAGANTCSHVATWLKVATTSLIVLLAGHDSIPVGRIRLASPVDAMNAIARDMTCRKAVRMADGSQKSALDLQRIYLNAVVQRLDEPYMPEWGERACKIWSDTLDALSESPQKLGTRLDWLLKRELFIEFVRKCGFEWESLNQLQVTPSAAPEYNALRCKLFELDVRFGQLGDLGIFNTLDRSGLLNHQVCDLGDLDRAIEHPPSAGRAKVRGEWIRKLNGQPDLYCSWAHIIDRKKIQMLDFSDPFATIVRWTPIQSPPLPRQRSPIGTHGNL